MSETLDFSVNSNPAPKSAEERATILENPGFGNHFTDHQAIIEYTADADGNGDWHDARIEAYGPITLDPAAAVLHYAQEIFEGMKAYRHQDGSIWSFRPEENAKRLNNSAKRMALPTLPEEAFLEAVKLLVQQDQDWVPDGEGMSLYIRPYVFATEAFLGVRPAKKVEFRVIASPAAGYFGPNPKPVTIWVSRNYARAGHGGTGAAKAGGNYAASLLPQMEALANGCDQVLYLDPTNDEAIEEAGTMNICFVFSDGRLVSPELTDNVLRGITRDSVLQVAKDQGLDVQERKITLEEVRQGIESGDITEIFACGTAAVITPIGTLKDGDEIMALPEDTAFTVTNQIRDTLVGMQTGTVEDSKGWMTRLV